MRCPACNTENAQASPRCNACGSKLSRRSRRISFEDVEDAFARNIAPSNRAAVRAYRLVVLALIPGLGLVLGPVALVLGAVARWRARSDPQFTAYWPAWTAVVLGALLAATNWAGLVLMVAGLRR